MLKTETLIELEEQGYGPGAPHGSAEIDSPICAESICESCGHKGLKYYPFVKYGDRFSDRSTSYIAIMACPNCNDEQEF